ncbi:serine--tRNA ligase [Rhodobium gokarnense]|uniref:Serine--tRNA ligase n=1 Tax=Rhodobium gokarnense TaxID=364296 RepID=A0ABT3HFM4_9HYPH|nr:serine--tRNA ligase [Rhodobium gokarnense]MCW2309210.1 seryl-tRNA synthetase [Rhodobium gokarnense]
MFDIKWIRDNPLDFDRGLEKRGLPPLSAKLITMDDARRAHITKLQDAQERRNAASKEIGKAKGSGDEETAKALIDEVAKLKSFVQGGEEEERRLTAGLEEALSAIPNLPLDDVPVGPDEDANVEVRRVGDKPSFDFAPKEHFELGEALGLMDFEAAARMAGSRFVVMQGGLARLHRALAQFMLDLQTLEHGYTETIPPLLVRDEAVYGTAQLPKFAEDLFKTTDGRWLIPTAEVPLTNLARERIFEDADLPMRVTALTPCFRSEAGSAGRDVRGMLRQHQFDKVELVSVTRADDSVDELERMVGCAEEVLKRLGLHYRVVTLSTGDMGFGARKTYDIEVWLPGQDMFREISSCSVCGDFQARRMNARYRPAGEKGLKFCHTLNGSGIAVGRALIAVMENYQTADGAIAVPEALKPYLGGLEKIGGPQNTSGK